MINQCSNCNKELTGQYVSPRRGIKHCFKCYKVHPPKTFVWWVSFLLVEIFIMASIVCGIMIFL